MVDDELKFETAVGCLDHTLHLAVEESLNDVPEVGKSVKKGRSLAALFSRSQRLRNILKQVLRNLGEEDLAVQIGTENRWFYRWMETKRHL